MANSLGEIKVKYGSVIRVGNLTLHTDKHFTIFQKKMIKWFLGFEVEDCSGGVE